MPLDPLELAQIQVDAALQACDIPCTVQRATTTDEPQGGKTQAWTTVATCLAGMSQPSAGQLQNFDYLVGSLAAWQVKLPIGTNVQEKDQLIIAGQTLNVVKLLNPRSYPALLTVLATEVK